MRVFSRVTLAMLALISAGQAFADLAATHIIRNEVTATYSDAIGTPVFDPTATATIDITINLVQQAPDVAFDALASDPIDSVSTNETVTLVFNVTSNANGVDDYEMENEALSNTAAAGSSFGAFAPDPLTLGASTATATVIAFTTTDETDDTAAGTEIVVPADDDGSDDEINGFVTGNIIVLRTDGGTTEVECRVNEIVEPAPGSEANATASIWVDQCDAAGGFTLALGDQVSERATISIDITAGTTAGDLDFDADVDFVGGGVGTSIATVTITVVAPDLDVYKFVRNITTGANNPACAATPLSCLVALGNTYHRTGVTAQPGDTLEYAILLFNEGGLVTDVAVTDDIVAFTAFETTSIDIVVQGSADDTGDCVSVATSGTCTVTENGTPPGNASDGAGDDYGALVGSTVTVSAGHDGTGTAIGDETTGGQLGPDEVSVVVFQVTVSN